MAYPHLTRLGKSCCRETQQSMGCVSKKGYPKTLGFCIQYKILNWPLEQAAYIEIWSSQALRQPRGCLFRWWSAGPSSDPMTTTTTTATTTCGSDTTEQTRWLATLTSPTSSKSLSVLCWYQSFVLEPKYIEALGMLKWRATAAAAAAATNEFND